MTRGLLVWNPNPTLDVASEVDALAIGAVNSAHAQTFSAGGKGTLVVRALAALASPCLGVAPIAGPSGDLFAALVNAEGLPFELDRVDGATRAAVSVVDVQHGVTVVNGPGPATEGQAWARHIAHIERLIDESGVDFFIMAGRPPIGAPVEQTADVCRLAASRGVRTIVDVASPVLEAVVATEPWLVKVNRSEAEQALGASSDDRALLETVLRAGARNVVLTDGPGDVAVSLMGAELRAKPPDVNLRSAVGCGDCFLAGLMHALSHGDSTVEAIRSAIALASASAEWLTPGSVNLRRAGELRAMVHIEEA